MTKRTILNGFCSAGLISLVFWLGFAGWNKWSKRAAELSWEAQVIKSHRVRALSPIEFQSYLERAEKGDPEAAVVVSQRYLFNPRYSGEDGDSKISAKNHMLVLNWLRVAAVLGRADAQSDLHTFLYRSSDEEDRKEARRWLEKSAEQGFPPSIERLARIRKEEAATVD